MSPRGGSGDFPTEHRARRPGWRTALSIFLGLVFPLGWAVVGLLVLGDEDRSRGDRLGTIFAFCLFTPIYLVIWAYLLRGWWRRRRHRAGEDHVA